MKISIRKNKKIDKKKIETMTKVVINILDEKELVIEFEIDYPCKDFEYKGKKYDVKNSFIYLKFLKKGYTPYLFYNIDNKTPIDFKNRNKGIPSRALKLLWNTNMYKILFTPELDKTNKLIIICLVANIIVYAINLYLRYR
ncbi:MAG: hypothetical protein MUO82_10820 [Candidatus Thermoplasmatota archaeon]|nr:hypothetical protein [Candidatus Thermoplasmatota archaeon]